MSATEPGEGRRARGSGRIGASRRAEKSSDAKLLDAWRTGDPVAGAALFERHFHVIRGFLGKRIDAEDAEDATQRVFLACLHSRGAFRGDASFRTYAFTIARHELFRHLRRRTRDAITLGLGTPMNSVQALAPPPSSQVCDEESRSFVRIALSELSDAQRRILELRYWHELPAAEIAQIMQIPEPTVRTRLFRAREALRLLLVSKHLEGGVAPAARARG